MIKVEADAYMVGPVIPAPETRQDAWEWILEDASRHGVELGDPSSLRVNLRRNADHGIAEPPQVYLRALVAKATG